MSLSFRALPRTETFSSTYVSLQKLSDIRTLSGSPRQSLGSFARAWIPAARQYVTVNEIGSERESDGTATFTQLSSPAEPRGTDVGHRHPLGRGHRGRDWFGRDAEGAGLRLNWAGHGERLDEGVGISGIPGL